MPIDEQSGHTAFSFVDGCSVKDLGEQAASMYIGVTYACSDCQYRKSQTKSLKRPWG